MKDMIKFKSIKSEASDIDEKTNTVVVYYAVFNNKDRVGDVITNKAFNKTIAERGPSGSNEIWHLFNHNKDFVAGKPKELIADTYGLKGVTKLANTTAGRDAIELYKEGMVTHHSIGYFPIKEEKHKDFNEIQEIKLYEGSHVLWPANPLANTVSIDLKGDLAMELNDLEDILTKYIYFCRNAKASDELIVSIAKKAEELEDLISHLKNTLPPKDTKPDNDNEILDSIKKFNSLFKTK